MGRSFFFILSSRDLGMQSRRILFHLSLFLLPKLSCLCFFSSSDWLWIFKSFLNLLGVDRFFVLIFRFVLQFFFVIFQWFFHHFFSFFPFLRLSHLLWSFECVGDFFVFNIVFLFYFQLPSLFSSFFSFVSIFMSKKIMCFIFIFRGDRLSNGFAQKAPARVFLQKLQRRHGTTESNRHFFFHFFGFFLYLFMYIYVHSYT